MVQAKFDNTFEGWRDQARKYISLSVPPSEINWSDETPSLLSTADTSFKYFSLPPRLSVPPDFLNLAENVSYARDADRWSLMYRILFRLQYENPHLLRIHIDPDIHRAELLRKSVRRDIHKMHAFVRFKKTEIDGNEFYLAWHKPEHLIVRPGTPFFARRFGDKPWSIFTPDESAHWDLKNLTFGPGIPQSEFNVKDDWDELWKTYYKSIFNPSRIKIKAMKLEMAPKYWSTLPEAELIRDLIREAPERLQTMAKNQNRAAVVDPALPIKELRAQAASCKSCPLYANATQTVFGVGPENAELMIVGEQPGDQEDLTGKPFVGSAGEVLLKALESAHLNKEKIYVTNAVKHFKWKANEKVRLHQKPSGAEMHACKPWLEAEIAQVKPRVIIALGVTAATAVLGRLPKISEERGRVITNLKCAPVVIVSWHPSAILRSSPDQADKMRRELIQDLALAKKMGLAHEEQSPVKD